jgi:hypothetical protein
LLFYPFFSSFFIYIKESKNMMQQKKNMTSVFSWSVVQKNINVCVTFIYLFLDFKSQARRLYLIKMGSLNGFSI